MLGLFEVIEMMQEGKLVIRFNEDADTPLFEVVAQDKDIIDIIDYEQLSAALLFASLLGFENPKNIQELMEEFLSMGTN